MEVPRGRGVRTGGMRESREEEERGEEGGGVRREGRGERKEVEREGE